MRLRLEFDRHEHVVGATETADLRRSLVDGTPVEIGIGKSRFAGFVVEMGVEVGDGSSEGKRLGVMSLNLRLVKI